MARKFLVCFGFTLLGLLQIEWLMTAVGGRSPAMAQTSQTVDVAHPSEAALNDPDIVQDFMAALPSSDPIPRQYPYFNHGTLRTETIERAEQAAYYRLRQSVTAHRFLTNKGRGRREMKAILLRSAESFKLECASKGGTLEPHESEFYALTRSNIRPKTSLNTLEICMRSNSESLGALLTETTKNSYDHDDEDSHSIITFHPVVVITQSTLDARADREAAAQRKREAAWKQERVEVERWRTEIKPGTETGCGPVLRVNGDLIEVVHYQTRDPKWYRRTELSPTLYNLAGLRTCD